MDQEKNSFGRELLNAPRFWRAQQKDWKVTVVRSSLERLGYQMVYPYLSLFIIALGATKSQLGTITSIGMLVNGLLGPMVGRSIDRNGAKHIYLLGIVMLVASYLLYGFAPGWQLCILAMVIYYFGQGLSTQSCSTICGNCLRSCDRARGMLICETFAAGLMGMAGPMASVFLLTRVMHADRSAATPDEIRVLFFVAAALSVLSLILVQKNLSNQKWGTAESAGKGALQQGFDILRTNKNARKWIFIAAVGNLPTAMVVPYMQVYAGEVKGASVAVLGYMVTATALTSMIFGYPVGALADRFGRKRVLFITIPLFWLANVLLILAPNPAYLILAGMLNGFMHINGPLTGAIQRELVPREVMGIWIGTIKFTNAISSAVMALLAGVIYEAVGPAWTFLLYVLVDACVRVPLLISIPETLKK